MNTIYIPDICWRISTLIFQQARQKNETCTGTKENPKQELNYFSTLNKNHFFSPFSHNCAHEPSNKTATMYLLFWFLFGDFEISNLFSDFLFWFLSDISRVLTFFSRLVVSTKFRSFLISFGSPDFKPLFWNSYFFFHFRVLTLST